MNFKCSNNMQNRREIVFHVCFCRCKCNNKSEISYNKEYFEIYYIYVEELTVLRRII